jgi:hypothetical protein
VKTTVEAAKCQEIPKATPIGRKQKKFKKICKKCRKVLDKINKIVYNYSIKRIKRVINDRK